MHLLGHHTAKEEILSKKKLFAFRCETVSHTITLRRSLSALTSRKETSPGNSQSSDPSSRFFEESIDFSTTSVL